MSIKLKQTLILLIAIVSRRVAFQPVAASTPLPILQDQPLPSQATWMDMMSRLEAKHGPKRKRKSKKTKSKDKKTKKTKRPTKAEKKAYQAALKRMILKKSAKAIEMTLLDVVKVLPDADRTLKVYPNRSTLNSLVRKMPNAKKKLWTFLTRQ